MSQLPRSKISSETNCKSSSSGNVFSQLRHLAVDVENGIENLQQELDSKRLKNESDTKHTLAINFLLHTKKDMMQLRDEATTKYAEFSKENTRISRVQELINRLLTVHSDRLDKAETYMEKYGYKRPVAATAGKIKDDVIESKDSYSADDDNELENNDLSINGELINNDENGICETTPSQARSDRQTNSTILLTPKLEDVFKHLSEETILLIKQGVKSTSQDENAPKEATAIKENVFSSITSTNHSMLLHKNDQARQRTPEPPQLLSGILTLNGHNIKRETSQIDTNGCGTSESLKIVPASCEYISYKSNTSSLYSELPLSSKNRVTVIPETPETPSLLTGLVTFDNHSRKFETCKGYVAASTTPDTPKLVTPGGQLTRFSSRKTRKNCEVPDLASSQFQTVEASTILLSGIKQTGCYVSQSEKGRSKPARSLFNTPELKSNILSSQTAYLSTPELPELRSSDIDFSRHIGYTSESHKKHIRGELI